MVSAAAAAAPGGRGCPCARPHRAGPNRTSRPASSPSPHPLGVRGDGGAVLSHGGPARPWRAPSWARGAGRREGRGAAVVKVLPWQRGGTGSPGGPQPPAAQLPGRGVSPRPSVVGTASDGPGADVTRECCFWGVFRGFLPEFNFGLSCHDPQVPYVFNAFIYSGLTKVWAVLSV